MEYRQKMERDLVLKIGSTLEPLLGADKFRAGASVEVDFTSADQSEETFDPARSAMVTAQKTEDISGVALQAGVPGTASNLPRPPPRQPGSGERALPAEPKIPPTRPAGWCAEPAFPKAP